MPDTRPSPWLSGVLCRCPRCGKGPLFSGFLTIAKHCNVCGLDYGFADSGDGPAVFVIFVAGIAIIALALVVDNLFHPPAWVHLLLWIPSTLVLCLALLRPFKGVLITLQYDNDAHEGRHDG